MTLEKRYSFGTATHSKYAKEREYDMRHIAKEAEIELSVKVILAVVIGMTLSEALGWRNSLTITFTMILVTYLNRGFYGVRTYYRVRMQTQVLLCLLMFMMVVPLQRYTQLDGWIILLLTVTPVAAFFLYLYFGWSFTPMNLSPVISPLMLMNTALKNPDFYYWRIIFTFIALILGWGITMIYPFRSKVGRTKKSLEHIAVFLAKELEDLGAAKRFTPGSAYAKQLPDITYEVTEITAYLGVVYQDVATPKYSMFKKDVPTLKALQAVVNAQMQLLQCLSANGKALSASDPEFKDACYTAMENLAACTRAALETGDVSSLQAPFSQTVCSFAETTLLSALVTYKRQVLALAALCKTSQPVSRGVCHD